MTIAVDFDSTITWHSYTAVGRGPFSRQPSKVRSVAKSQQTFALTIAASKTSLYGRRYGWGIYSSNSDRNKASKNKSFFG